MALRTVQAKAALVLATGGPDISRMTLLESFAMRLYQQIRASIARVAIVGAGLVLFISGMPLSASGQTVPPAPSSQATPLTTPVTVQGTPLSLEEAVRMGLENNLNVQIEKL